MPAQITAIASQLASELPTDGVDLATATASWRSTLHLARKSKLIDDLTERIETERPGLRVVCAELRRR